MFDNRRHGNCRDGICRAFPGAEFPPEPDIMVQQEQCITRQELQRLIRENSLFPGYVDIIYRAMRRVDDLTESFLEACKSNDELRLKTDMFTKMEDECWDLKTLPTRIDETGCGGDVVWVVVEHFMAEPNQRIVAFGKSPIEALTSAIKEPMDLTAGKCQVFEG